MPRDRRLRRSHLTNTRNDLTTARGPGAGQSAGRASPAAAAAATRRGSRGGGPNPAHAAARRARAGRQAGKLTGEQGRRASGGPGGGARARRHKRFSGPNGTARARARPGATRRTVGGREEDEKRGLPDDQCVWGQAGRRAGSGCTTSLPGWLPGWLLPAGLQQQKDQIISAAAGDPG